MVHVIESVGRKTLGLIATSEFPREFTDNRSYKNLEQKIGEKIGEMIQSNFYTALTSTKPLSIDPSLLPPQGFPSGTAKHLG